MAAKRKTKTKARAKTKAKTKAKIKAKRKSYYIKAGRPGHIKRGCGPRNWRRGSNAYWRCAVGKKHPYKAYKKKRSVKR